MLRLSKRMPFAFRSTLLGKLVVAFFLFILLPMTVSNLLAISVLENKVREKVNDASLLTLSQAKINSNRVFDDMYLVANTLLLDEEVTVALKRVRLDAAAATSIQRVMDSKFFKLQTSILDVYPNNFISIVTLNEQFFSTLPYDLSRQVHESFDGGTVTMKHTYEKITLGGHAFIVLETPYYDLITGIRLGNVLVGVPEKALSDVLEGLSIAQGYGGFLIDREGNLVTASAGVDYDFKLPPVTAQTQTAHIHQMEAKDGSSLINYAFLEKPEWFLVEEVPEHLWVQEISATKERILYLNLIFFLILLMISYFMAAGISKPIRRLVSAANRLAKGDLHARVPVAGQDEIGRLSHTFNVMAAEMGTLIDRINEEQNLKRELELNMLYAQLNPHFLFNTLNSIRWMADASKVYNVSKVIVALASLLRSSILRSGEIITIKEEVENVKNYLYIQKLRYAALFQEEYDIDETIGSCGILKLILQPIVENTIIHGFKEIDYLGMIRIQVKEEAGLVVVRIEDNGVGMDEGRIQSVLRTDSQRSSGKLSGIGIHHVNQRLILHYGKESAIRIVSKPGVGTVTSISIPKKKAEELHA